MAVAAVRNDSEMCLWITLLLQEYMVKIHGLQNNRWKSGPESSPTHPKWGPNAGLPDLFRNLSSLGVFVFYP